MTCLPVQQILTQADNLFFTSLSGGGNALFDEAVVPDRKALDLCHPSHPMRPIALSQLAGHLSARQNQHGKSGTDNLDQAIACSREALALCPPK